MIPPSVVTVYSTTDQNLYSDFNAAVEFIGQEWLSDIHDEYYDTPNDGYIAESPPSLVTWYHSALSIISGRDTIGFELDTVNESALRFFQLGGAISSIEDSPVITKSGGPTSRSVRDLYVSDLQSSGQNPEELIHEILTAALYDHVGHDIAFIDEEVSQGKAPEFRITDSEPSVDIECKHARVRSHEEEQVSALIEELFDEIATSISHPFIGYIDAGEDPTPTVVRRSIAEFAGTDLTTYEAQELPIGELHLIPIYPDLPFEIYDNVIAEYGLIPTIQKLLIDPALESQEYVEIDRAKHGALPILTNSQPWGEEVYFCAWLGVSAEIDVSANVDRAVNQFSGVSGKFTEQRAGLLHLNIPAYQSLSSEDTVNLRNEIAGELVQRDSLAGTIVSSMDYLARDDDWCVDMTLSPVPHYNPGTPLPEDFDPLGLDFSLAMSAHQMMDESLDEEGSVGPEGIRDVLEQDEGSISCVANTSLLYSSATIGEQSESGSRALIFGGSDSEWGEAAWVDITRGAYVFKIPPRFRDLDRVGIAIAFSPDFLLMHLHPIRKDVDTKPATLRVESPTVRKPSLSEEKLAEVTRNST